MSVNSNSENTIVESEKPVQVPLGDDEKFPPFPDPTDTDFDEDITEEERNHYKTKFKDLNSVVSVRSHCSACDRHLGCSAVTENRVRAHPMLRTLMCHTCLNFYNSGEFEKGDDGSELYCRWCGQGGQVYCCSACPHVFCAKCIKRNLGLPKIKEIEETDDWKCFRCNTMCLWDLRAICWAVLRYCDLRYKITQTTEDPVLKEAYQKECALDKSECCRSKNRRKDRNDDKKPKAKEEPAAKKPVQIITKVSSMIQVKKFASINQEEQVNKIDKKTPIKRPCSPKTKSIFIKNPVTKIINPVMLPATSKKIKMSSANVVTPWFSKDKKPGNHAVNTYPRVRHKNPAPKVYNGYINNPTFGTAVVGDNINLSLENLTQGLDMAAIAALNSNPPNDDVVCTPDFPLEALSETTEDNNDDDVQCIGPVVAPKPAPVVPKTVLSELLTENIIQMTENDVTVNAATGGLKFRVDPQTLSSNKMYRLPDGRIFAINSNPNMPGGYSATIVAITENSSEVKGRTSKGSTYAAKLSSVGYPMLSPPPLKCLRGQTSKRTSSKRSTPKCSKDMKQTDTPTRECDLNVPVEWFRYNLIDAADALEYSLSKLNKLKQEATTMYLRTRTVDEMRNLHRRLERLLNMSSCRFNEIRDGLNKELRQYLSKKMVSNTSDDDDDVEILPEDDNDDPIFIDENSVESNTVESHDVDLTCVGSSDHNDSSEKLVDKNNSAPVVNPSTTASHYAFDNDIRKSISDGTILILNNDEEKTIKDNLQSNNNDSKNSVTNPTLVNPENILSTDAEILTYDVNGEVTTSSGVQDEDLKMQDKVDGEVLDNSGQSQRDENFAVSEMNEEIIKTLLCDEEDMDAEVKSNVTPMDTST